MNGITWAMSGVFAVIRAITRDRPVLNIDCRTSAGTSSSHETPGSWPKPMMMIASAASENSSCWSCWRASETGSEARGKCSARTRPMLPVIARVPDHDRVGREGPDEHARDQPRDVVRRAGLVAHQDAEDEVVHRRVQERGHQLPDLAQLRLAVLRGQLGGGERGDEVAPGPQLPYVLGQRGAGAAHLQAVLRGQLGRAEGLVAGVAGRTASGWRPTRPMVLRSGAQLRSGSLRSLSPGDPGRLPGAGDHLRRRSGRGSARRDGTVSSLRRE